jgi:predicted nucleotide-binding protein (sugar kinase/HSP70/actin superfamily)
LASDATNKLLLKTRPYETTPGDADEVYETSLTRLDKVVSRTGIPGGQMRKDIRDALEEIGAAFRSVPARYTKDRPLIGVVGEIYCRLNDFSNRDALRRIEAHGGEAWLSDLCEWVWYTGWSQVATLRRTKRTFSREMLKALLKNFIQRHDEHFLLHPLAEDFTGLEEPTDVYRQVLKPGWPYLPADGALGEMVLSVGKSVYLYGKGADGIIDISPFSCMNGIVSESVYHSLSRDHGGMPIRNFYFDATTSNMDRDLDIFMELARSYQARKTRPRTYPEGFVD